MTQEHPSNVERIASSAILLAWSRISMALALPAIGLIAALGGAWLDQKFAAQDVKIDQQRTSSDNESRIQTSRIERIEKTATSAIESASKVNERLISVETKQTQDSSINQQFQQATLTRLDRMQDSLVSLSNSIAALTATLQERTTRGQSTPPNRN